MFKILHNAKDAYPVRTGLSLAVMCGLEALSKRMQTVTVDQLMCSDLLSSVNCAKAVTVPAVIV